MTEIALETLRVGILMQCSLCVMRIDIGPAREVIVVHSLDLNWVHRDTLKVVFVLSFNEPVDLMSFNYLKGIHTNLLYSIPFEKELRINSINLYPSSSCLIKKKYIMKTSVSLLILCFEHISLDHNGVLKSPVTVLLSISPFMLS